MQRRLLDGPFQRLKKHAAKLIAATLFLAGAGTGLYYVTGVDSGPVGAVIVAPADNSTHTTDADGCANGFTTDVVVRTSAPDGTDAVLTADGLRVAEASVSGGAVTFPSVMLGTRGKHVLVAQVADARAVSTLTVACEGHPTCRMLGPTWAPDTPGLNGNPRRYDAGADSEADPWVTWTSQGGDRTSSAGSPYQYRIDLLTGVGAGSVVEVYVDGSKTGTAPRLTGGTHMQIHGVPIGADDGDHSVYLKCVGPDSVGFSTRGLVSADTKPPQLTTLTPQHGDRVAVEDGKLRVCASSTSPDALGLSADLGEAQSNLCVAMGTSTPTCASMTAGGAAAYWTSRDASVPDASSLCDGALTCPCPGAPEMTCTDSTQSPNGACVELDCSGTAPFDLRVSVYDGVRNISTKTIQAVSCWGVTGPSVEIIDPIGGSRLEVMADLAKRVLVNAGPRRDENLAAPGAQYTVIACTNAAEGSAATLHAGEAGETLAQVATTTVVAADAGASACPLHRPYEARFAGATLPDSWVDGLGRLKTATRLRVDVDGADAGVGASPVVDLWVDSTLPEVASDDPLCGTTLPEAGTYPLRIRSSALPVTVTVTNSQGTQTYMGLSAEPEM